MNAESRQIDTLTEWCSNYLDEIRDLRYALSQIEEHSDDEQARLVASEALMDAGKKK